MFVTISEFSQRLTSTWEGEGPFSALRRLTRLEDSQRLARVLSSLQALGPWHGSAQAATPAVTTGEPA